MGIFHRIRAAKPERRSSHVDASTSPLAGKVAIITGASRGIGRATALALGSRGVHLALTSRQHSQNRLAEVAEALASAPITTLSVAADLAHDEDRVQLVQQVLDTFGRVDILVNNAGVAFGGALHEMPAEQLHQILTVNVHGTFRLTQLVLPHMLAQKSGHIVFMSSSTAGIAVPGISVYSATKAAIRVFSSCLRRELAGSGVRVSTVLPGMVRTDMVRDLLNEFEQKGEGRPAVLRPLLAVVQEPETVAKAIVAILLSYRRELWLGGAAVTMGKVIDVLTPGALDALFFRVDNTRLTTFIKRVGH